MHKLPYVGDLHAQLKEPPLWDRQEPFITPAHPDLTVGMANHSVLFSLPGVSEGRGAVDGGKAWKSSKIAQFSLWATVQVFVFLI